MKNHMIALAQIIFFSLFFSRPISKEKRSSAVRTPQAGGSFFLAGRESNEGKQLHFNSVICHLS